MMAGIFLIYVFYSLRQTRECCGCPSVFIRILKVRELRESLPLLLLFALVMGFYTVALVYLRAVQPPAAERGAFFYERYLIALVPLGVVIMTVFSRYLIRALRPVVLKWCGAVVLSGILIMRLVLTYDRVHLWVGF
jgi:hypothetical protein